jgi:hypothetical protein
VEEEKIIKSVQHWLDHIVIDLNLCPFAKAPRLKNSIRFKVSNAESDEALLLDLAAELSLLDAQDRVETTLLILSTALSDFHDYNQFLDLVDDLLMELKLEGVFQVASFHPAYQFAETDVEDVENFTNKSPYPIFHILRESSLDRAVQTHPDTSLIPSNNARLMRQMGMDRLMSLWNGCFEV